MSILIKGMEMPKRCVVCNFGDALMGKGFCYVSHCKQIEDYFARNDRPSWCPLAKLITIEELMEPMCDQCQWLGWYKDPDDLQREKCSRCPVEAKLAEALYDAD